MSDVAPAVRLRGIGKRFPGVIANDDINIDVMMTSRTDGSAVLYWSESTPIARLPDSEAASNTPPPEPPAAW